MSTVNSENIKTAVFKKGADLCGIASVSRFHEAPEGFHPCDIYDACKSVVVYGVRFPVTPLHSKSNSPYTFARNMMVQKLDTITYSLSEDLEKAGIPVMPVPSSEPYDFWDSESNHGRGILSLKHAAMLAGLGKIGKNTLLINNQFGNMIWLGALLISRELEQDPLVRYDACLDGCRLCLDICPQEALDGVTLNQKKCRQVAFSSTPGGGMVVSCNLCRKICPHREGFSPS